MLQTEGEALVDPARLGWGLAEACERLGVRIVDGTSLVDLERRGAGMAVRTDFGTIACGAAVLGAGAFASPVRAINRRVVPVYDYVLATEPLDRRADGIGRLARAAGRLRQAANQFHYYRLTQDRRIVWGGYDAVFHN